MYENLTTEQRLQRIAQIINKGIYLLALKEGWFENSVKEKKKITKTEALSFEEQQIVDLCKKKGRITNRDVQELLGLHRVTVTLRLREMVTKGLLVKKGNCRHTYYAINMCIYKIVL